MNILTHFQQVLEKNMKDNLNKYLNNTIDSFNNPYCIDSYRQFVEDFDNFTESFTIDAYQSFILALDQEFMDSNVRKQRYTSKGFVTKSLLTKFGWIKLKRRRYVDLDGKSFMFIDRLLGLIKYKRMDIFVIGDLIEDAADNSYAKAGRNVSKTIGNKIKYDDDINKNILSRATVRNNVIEASKLMNEPDNNIEEIKAKEILNIMVDEKFVASQFNNKKDHMIKAAVVFEDTTVEYKGRNRLISKKVFGDINGNLQKQVLDYIHYNYDTDKIKRINIMGDGALWIKSFALDSSFKYHKDLEIKYGLDKFHLTQAIMHITTKKEKDTFYPILLQYVIDNKKEDFEKVIEALITREPHREDTIREKANYIINNWRHIQASFHDIKYKCSMESNISHVFADIFTSRPKAYSKEGLNNLLNIRLLKINGHDLKKTYFESLKKDIDDKITSSIIERNIIKNKFTKYKDYFYSKFVDPNLNKSFNNTTII